MGWSFRCSPILRRRLREYVADSVQAQNPNAQAEYAAHLDRLAAQLNAYQAEASPAELLRSIGGDLAWFERRGQASQLVAAVKQQLAQPNSALHGQGVVPGRRTRSPGQ